jgi:hypothetical protein
MPWEKESNGDYPDMVECEGDVKNDPDMDDTGMNEIIPFFLFHFFKIAILWLYNDYKLNTYIKDKQEKIQE